MKKLTSVLCAVVLVCGAVGIAKAELHYRGGGMIYDDVLNITWLQDANHAGVGMSVINSTAWAASLEYGGYDDWRLPNADKNGDGTIVAYSVPVSTEEACRDNEYAYMYHFNLGGTPGTNLTGNQTVGDVTLYNIQAQHWSSTWFGALGVGFNFLNGNSDSNHQGTLRTPWAVRDGDIHTATEESTWGRIKSLYQ